MSEPQRACPDCATAMQPIKLIDATEVGFYSGGVAHVELAYSAPDAKATSFTQKIPMLETDNSFAR